MKLSIVLKEIEQYAPLALQEGYDNAGLYCGDPDMEVDKILLSLDITEEVVEEAIETGCQLVLAHHPIIFKPLRKLTGGHYTERVLLKAIKNSIALYAAHTNLDNVKGGVNFKLAEKIGLKNVSILQPIQNALKKLTVFVPLENTSSLLLALGEAGAGQLGNYKNCSFRVQGTGTFMPNADANPYVGQPFQQEEVQENRIEVLFPNYLEQKVLSAMYSSHPYEEVAYYISTLTNANQEIGAGAIGELGGGVESQDFLNLLKDRLKLNTIKYTPFAKLVKKVAVCGGSGSFLLKGAISKGADAFVSSDFKYHEFFEAEGKIMIADIGHYESEVFTKELFFELLNKKMPNIAILFSTVNTNPVKYYH